MKQIPFFVAGVLALGLMSCSKSGTPLDTTVQEHTENLKLLNQKITEQEAFMTEAKKVLSEHRAHILEMEKKLGPLKRAAKSPSRKRR